MENPPELTARQRYRAAYKEAHPEAYKEGKKRCAVRAIQIRAAREVEDPVLRDVRLARCKVSNDAHREARRAYDRAYTRDPLLRDARLAARKVRNEANKEVRNAYNRAYRARMRAARLDGAAIQGA